MAPVIFFIRLGNNTVKFMRKYRCDAPAIYEKQKKNYREIEKNMNMKNVK